MIESRPAPERLGELERLARCELLPALRAVSGFCGAVGLVERERPAVLLVLLWETDEDAAGEASAALAELLGPYSESIWEVNARA